MAVLNGRKTSRRKKIFFSLKKWTYGTYGLPTGPKVGQFFFLAAPKFYPRQKDPKRVLKAGAWGFVPKSAVWGPLNPEIRNLRPPKFGKKNFFRTCNIFFPKDHPKRSLTHPHRPPSDQNCPRAPGAKKSPYVELPCGAVCGRASGCARMSLRVQLCVGGRLGRRSTPGHKPRSPVGRRAVCTERGGGWLHHVQGPGPRSTVELVLPEPCCSYGSQPGWLLGPFWPFSTAKKQAGAKNIFS